MASSGHVAFYPAFAQIEGRGVVPLPPGKFTSTWMQFTIYVQKFVMFYIFEKLLERFRSGVSIVCISIIVKVSVHPQVEVASNHDVIEVNLFQNGEDIFLEKLWIITL